MPDCRICGASCSQTELDANGCVNCQGSPDCARCGHARSKHSGSYGNGPKLCRAEVPLTGDSLLHTVKWKSHAIGDLPPGTYHLRLHLHHATLYALSTSSD